MSTIIQIKRSSGSAAPSTSALLEGEMAYAQDASGNGANAVLYIESMEGGSAAIHAVGGKKFTAAVDAATDANTASTIVKRDASGNFSAGTITANLTGEVSTLDNHDTDALDEGSTNLYFTETRARDSISVSGDLSYDSATGVISFNAEDVSLSGFDTDDLNEGSTNLYFTSGRVETAVDNYLVGGTALSYNAGQFDLDDTAVDAGSYGSDSSVATFTVDAQGRLTAAGSTTIDINANQVNDFNDAIDDHLSGGTGIEYSSGTISIEDTAVTAGSYGSSTQIPTFTVDAQGRLTAASYESISTDLDISADTGTDTISLATETLDFTGGTGVSTSVSSGSVTISIGQDVDTDADVVFASVATDDIKSSGGTTALTLSGANVTVEGNLTVSGTTTTVNSTTLTVTDPLVFVGNDNNTTDAVDLGIFGMYDTSGSQDLYSGIFRDATDGKWKLFKDSQSAPTTTVNTGATGYTVATLVANLEGSLSGGTVSGLSSAIAVGDGGTGVTTLTANGVLFGGGTSAISATAVGTAGQVLTSGGSGVAPSFGNIDGGTY
jgi:hypothetical protein